MAEEGTNAGVPGQRDPRRSLGGRWLPLLAILVAGGLLRFYGLNWDGGQWLHPDERQIYFVTLGLRRPESLVQALSPSSPLNPGFFAYGSLPIYLLRLAAGVFGAFWAPLGEADNLHLAGRLLTGLLDLGTVALAYRLAGQLMGQGPGRRSEGHRAGLLAAALVAFAVVHIQAAHFTTADVLLTFLAALALSLAHDVASGAGAGRQAALGVAVGLALATKVAGAPLLLLVPLAYYLRSSRPAAPSDNSSPLTLRRHPIHSTLLVLLLAVLTFLLAQPYALLDWQTFLGDTLREGQIAWGRLDVPYTRQYTGTLPYLYPAWQVALWGLALPAGLLAWGGLAGLAWRWLRRGSTADALALAWAGSYFLITGLLYAKPLRYSLPLVPVLCAVAASAVVALAPKRRARVAGWALVLASLAYALLFAQLYAEPHSWISASAWIYEQVPAGSVLAVEDWDTILPLPSDTGGRARRIEEYDVRVLPVYQEPDGADKARILAAELAQADYLIIASRRAYGALPRLPDRYPLMARYYPRLFAGDLGFCLAGEFVRGPEWLNPRVPPLPGAAPRWLLPDESFVVYDHPRAMVWRNEERLPAEELLRRLLAGD